MQGYLTAANGPWLELVLVLAVGAVVIVGLAAVADRLTRSAIWQRTIWQIATLGMLALMLAESTGTGLALVRLWRAHTTAAAAQPRAAPSTAEGRPPAAVQPPATEDQKLLEEATDWPLARALAQADRTAAAAADFAWREAADDGGSGAADRRLFAAAGQGAPASGTAHPPQRTVPRSNVPEYASRGALHRGAAGEATAGGASAGTEQPWAGRPLIVLVCWWLGAVWALGALLITARTVCARVVLFVFWRRGARLSDGPLCERVARLGRLLGIRRRVDVLEGIGLRAPVAFGSIWPAVALPAGFANEFDRQQQDAMLAHELAHLAAHDPAWQMLAGLVCAASWWHPLVWWLRHRLHGASEAAADEASLLVPDGPDLLADCLVAMGRRLARVPSARRQLGWLSFQGPGFRSSLGRRVERLLKLRARSWRAPGRGRLLLAKTAVPVALVIVVVCCTAWARSQATLTEGGTTMSVLRVSWRHSLAAAMLSFVTAGCAQAVADDPPADQSLPAVAHSDLAGAQGQLVLLAENQEREKGEAREREEGEREKGEAREREEGEREKGEAREREEGEREKGEAREREGGERGEAEAGRARLAQELGRLEEKAQDIRRRLEGLRDDQDAEARELHGALREVEERMEAIRRELRGPEREGERRELTAPERAELEAQLRRLMAQRKSLERRSAAIQRQLQGLRRDEQAEQAGRLRGLLQDARAAAERLEAQMRETMQRLGMRRERPGPEQPRPDREQLQRRLEELQRQVARLAEAGKREQPEARQQELRKQMEARQQELREIKRLLAGGPEPAPPPGPAEDLQRRINHLKVAIENLHAAGLHDEAEGLVRQVDRLIEEHRRLTGRPPEPPRPPGAPEQPVPPELAERLEQQGQAIRELRGAMNELREQMAQLRQMLEDVRRPEREPRR